MYGVHLAACLLSCAGGQGFEPRFHPFECTVSTRQYAHALMKVPCAHDLEGGGLCHATPASSPSLFSFLFSFRLASPVSLRKHTPGSGSHWCLWSKPVNLGTWRLVPDPIAMAHAFAEPGYGTVVHTRENGFKCRPLFRGHTLFIERTTTTPVPIRLASNQPLPPRILQRRLRVPPQASTSCSCAVRKIRKNACEAGSSPHTPP